jgi:hypothetical protein
VSAVRHGLAFGFLAVLSGCVVIPYTPPSETQQDLTDVPDQDHVLLSVGPRRFLEGMAKSLRDQESRIEYVDGQVFLDTAAPDGHLTLARLLDPATRDRIAGLQTDYLVLFGEVEGEVPKTSGGMMIYMGFWGAQKATDATRYWVALIDLRTMRVIEQLITTSTGTDVALGLFYGIIVISDTDKSAQKGVIRNVVEVLSRAKPDGPLRLVMLAREERPTEAQLLAQAQAKELKERRGPAFWFSRVAAYPAFSEPDPPQEGEALIYLYHREKPDTLSHTSTGYAVLAPQILMTRGGSGEYVLARIWSGGYFPYRVAAGSTELWIEGESREPLTIVAESGGTYFLRVEKRRFRKAQRGSLEIVKASEAKSAVVLCRQLPSARDELSTLRTRAEDGYAYDQLELAQYLAIGVRYAADEALPRDPAEAFMWYTVIVTTEGVTSWIRHSAARAVDALTRQLSAEEIADATLRAAAWQTAYAARFGAPLQNP